MQEEELLFVVGQQVDEVVELLYAGVGRFGGEVGAELFVDGHEPGGALAGAPVGDGRIEGAAAEPGGGVVVVPEGGPLLPEVGYDVLVEVLGLVGPKPRPVEAHPEEEAAQGAEQLSEFFVCLVKRVHGFGV